MSLSRIGCLVSRNRGVCRLYSPSSYSLASRHRLRCPDDERYLKEKTDALYRPSFRFSLSRTLENEFNLTIRCGHQYFSSESSSQMVIGMPALSPTMTQGNISQWIKREGDKIEPGDVLCIIETDKASLEFESLEEGYLAKILVPDGTKDVPVGQPIAITVEAADEIVKVSCPSPSSKDYNDEQIVSSTTDSSNLPTHIVISMPALSPTMNQGNITRWRKKEGDKIEVGDVICEIETDKATLEFESLEESFLAKIVAPEGSKDVAVGQTIAVTVEDQNDIDAVRSSFFGRTQAKHEQPTQRDAKPKLATFSRISPAAKVLLMEHDLSSSQLEATGARNTLLKSDVLSAIKSGKLSKPKSHEVPSLLLPTVLPSQPQNQEPISFQDIPNSQIRKIIAKRLIESKQNTPHLYLSMDVVIDPLLAFRKDLMEKHSVKVSVNDVVIKAVALALRSVPKANAFWENDKGEVVLCDSVDIAIAVATEKGLITPVVKNADEKSISSISLEVKQLADKARAGKLAPHEFQGGSFSISNLGMYPVDHFSAIINPPQAGILAVGRGNEVVEPLVGIDGVEKPTIVNRMKLTLSADHRVFDGEVGGAFLSAVRDNFFDIRRLLI